MRRKPAASEHLAPHPAAMVQPACAVVGASVPRAAEPVRAQVFLTRRTAGGVPDFEALQARAGDMWRRPQWARGVAVDNASTPAPERPLSQRMQVLQGCCSPWWAAQTEKDTVHEPVM